MEQLEAGRVLMGDSLGFHIIFALLGVGLPLAVSIFEFIAIHRKDSALRENVKLWSYIIAVLAVVGVLSGTIVAMQMFLIWPGVLEFGGKTIAPAFMLEGYAFIFEAVFLAFYLATWDRLKDYKHWIITIPIILGATATAFLITSVSAFMNNPTGFAMVDGQMTNSQPWQAIFSQTSLIKSGHSILTYYLTSMLVIAGIYAWVLFRGKKLKVGTPKLAKFIVKRAVLISLVLLIGVAIMGDVSGKYLAKYEPTKLAAMELQYKTTANAPLTLGGSMQNDGSVKGGIQIPGALSFLAGNSTSTVVQGLDQTTKDKWPPLVVHTLFDIKLVLIGLLTAILLVFLYGYYRSKRFVFQKRMLGWIVALPIISLATVELGWIITEIGRQPYAVYGYLLTSEAFTTDRGVVALAWIYPTAFVFLFILTAIAIRMTIRRYKSVAKEKN